MKLFVNPVKEETQSQGSTSIAPMLPGFSTDWIEITLDGLKKFASASGDYNPIHQNEEKAKEVGLPGVIAHGMLVAAFISNALDQYSQKALSAHHLKSIRFRFKAMTFLNEKVRVLAEFKQKDELLECQLKCENENGEVKTQATAQLSR